MLFKQIKSAATEAAAQKTQTPIVAKLINITSISTVSIPMEFAFLSNSRNRHKKGIVPPGYNNAIIVILD